MTSSSSAAVNSEVAAEAAASGRTSHNSIDSRRALAALVPCSAAGALSMGIVPFIVSGLSSYGHLSAAQAGLCISAEMAGSVSGTAVIVFWLDKTGVRTLSAAALVLITLGNLLCLAAIGVSGYAAARFIAGVGCGLTIAVYSLVGETRSPERNFAILNVGNIALAAGCGAAVPWLFARAGVNALFVTIATASAVALLAVRWIPERAVFAVPSQASSGHPAQWRSRPAAMGSLMTLCYFTALGAFWAYAAEIGYSLHIHRTGVDATIATGYFVGGIVASFVATALSRITRPRALIVGGAIAGAVCVEAAILAPGTLVVYVIAVSLFIFAWFLVYPFLMGVLAEIDRSGRLVVLSVLIQVAGFVVGPALGAPLMKQQRFGAFGVLCVVWFMAAILCLLGIGKPSRHTAHE